MIFVLRTSRFTEIMPKEFNSDNGCKFIMFMNNGKKNYAVSFPTKQKKLTKKKIKDKNKLEFYVASWVHVILNIACVSINLTNFIKKKSFFYNKFTFKLRPKISSIFII